MTLSLEPIDVIIVNYRSADDTLAAVAMLTPWRHGRILVVDNSEDPVEHQRLRLALQPHTEVALLLPERNLGFGRGCNLAFAQSTAPFVLLLNPDARIDAKNVLLLVRALQDNPRYGALSPRIWWDSTQRFLLPVAFPPTPLLMLGMALASRWRRLTRHCAQRYLQRQQRIMAKAALTTTPFLAGAVMLVRREAVAAAGGLFDPDYFMFYEDSDLSLRLRNAGYRLGQMSAADAVHEYRHKPYKAVLMSNTALIFFAKHYPLFHRLTRGLTGLQRLRKPLGWEQWGLVLPAPVSSAAELQRQLLQAAGETLGVVALSPNPELMPALFRPAGATAQPLDDADFLRLEPGPYMLLCAPRDKAGPTSHISFERA
jgi:GT2 family glycosyltransferase